MRGEKPFVFLRVSQLADIRATERGIAATDRIAAAHGRAAVATRLHAAAQRRLVAATRTSTIVMAGLRRGLGLLGGPTGVVLLAAFAIYEVVSSMRAQRAALRETVPELDSFRESIERLTEAQLAVRGFEVEDRLRETQEEIRRVEGQLDALNARFSQTVHLRSIGLRRGSETRFAAFQRDVAGFTADLDTLRGNAAAAEQQLEALAAARRAAQFVGPLLPEPDAARPSREEPVDERAVTRAIQQLTRLRQTAEDDIAAAALSRIDQVTRAEQQANETIDRLIRERLVTEQQAEATRAAVGVQAALERQRILEDQLESEREIEQERLERVRERNTEAVAEIRRQLTALQPSYDQAVIAAIEWADQTIAGLDRQDAAFERNAETVRDVLDARIRLIRDERDAESEAESAQDARARQEIALEHARTLLQIQQRLVAVGLASRDAGVEAALWAQEVRNGIDRTAEGADEALRAIDEIVERQRQLASNDPLIGIRVGLDTYSNQLPTVAEQINTAVQNTLSETENAILNFVQTGKISFSNLVDSILADLARIALRQAILGPLTQALGSVLSGIGVPTAPAGSNIVLPTTNVPGFQRGGSFTIPGQGGADSRLVQFRATPGEHVTVSPQQGGPRVTVQIIDNRQGGEAPQVSESRGPDGGRQIRVLIEDTADQAVRGGRLDGALAARYGVRPSIAPR